MLDPHVMTSHCSQREDGELTHRLIEPPNQFSRDTMYMGRLGGGA